MPIFNTSTLYSKIASGSEGGLEFSRFVKTLLTADYHSRGINFISESDASGDYKKVDGYIKGGIDFPDNIVGFQFKFFPAKLSQNQKQVITKSIEMALEENQFIQDFILITPEDFMKEEQQWLDGIEHWGHTKIVELALKHEHVGRRYFPEFFSRNGGNFKLSYSGIDRQLSSWVLNGQNGYNLRAPSENYPNQVSDPIFDFTFKNNTSNIHLLGSIEIHIEKLWTTLKGLPQELFLHSLGTVEYEIDFNEPINRIVFPNPLMFESNKALRFHLRLTNFAQKCPHNNTQIKFWFHFDERSIPTDSFILGM